MKKLISGIILIFLAQYAYSQEADITSQNFTDNIRFENADKLYQLKYYDKALAYFGEYIELFPDGIHRVDVLNKIASIYFSKFKYDSAIKYYSIILEENSNTEEGLHAYYKIALCYSKMGDAEKANSIFRDIVVSNPSSAIAVKAKLQLDIEKIIIDD